ncbi:DUF2889 domain-containing protein [Ilumatobacter coccineus]|jgi:Protein of unknown function (DUF2889)|uniref:DUF2889 domain-containing protein n=1 Tax=Ilumatobacter coccineus (strain NBRC 103263 / KCTC 29153 / YM16-304) TaxID=1313172 RepID=A0A6C7E5H0_ILUCY|nr:DUF2889 domain-containing protein [Ilumatobacter coccineus]BAN03024.1 hypothetical protein YM304_27100 [Ilumatobacter coccineus YM16-304]
MSDHVTDSHDLFDHDSILPDDLVDESGQPLEVLHDREYRVRAFRKADDLVLIRGAVRDQKPPGLYFPTDPDPITVHHMQVDIEVRYPTMEIVSAGVAFGTHPNDVCPSIIGHYDKLVGLSIARGFTHKVRELFGGPRGCTHTTMLLQSMAPIAIQCMWSMRAAIRNREQAATAGDATDSARPASVTPEQREAMWRTNLNSCHVWAEDSETVANLTAGGPLEVPVFARERLVQLGMKPDDWSKQMG